LFYNVFAGSQKGHRREPQVKIGAFEVNAPIPELNEPIAFAVLRPWIDVNNVGTLVLNELEARFEGNELASFSKPGEFFDFTRYRPTIHLEEGIRRVTVPNVTVRYARRQGESDFLLLHLLEPHARSEAYLDSIMKLLKACKAKKYVLLGSMYDVVPHTRPLIVNGSAETRARGELKRSGALTSSYEGPTSIVVLVSQRAAAADIETLTFIVSLPQYVALEEDYLGKVRLMEVLNVLYDIPIDSRDFEKALEQRALVNQRVESTPELNALIPQLENMYEERVKSMGGESPKLTSEMEEILWKTMEGKEDVGKA
jgi:hypothetical protein